MEWKAMHYFIHDKNYQTDFLVNYFKPEIDTLFDSNMLVSFFYIGYWQGGNHIRFRFKTDHIAFVRDRMQQVFDHFLENYYPANVLSKDTYYRMFADNKEQVSDLEFREDQSVLEAPYLPETERYGGNEVMEYSEKIFHCSSTYALKLLSLMGKDTKRSIYAALDMMLCCLEEVNAGKDFLSYYIKFWNEFTREVPKVPFIAVNIASAYQDRYHKIKNKEIDFYQEWRECIKINKKEIMERQTSYSSSEAAWSMILASQIHMTNNRLGITPNYESILAQTLLILMKGDETIGV